MYVEWEVIVVEGCGVVLVCCWDGWFIRWCICDLLVLVVLLVV